MPLDQEHELLANIWEKNKHLSESGSLFIDVGTVLNPYFLYHSSVNVLEVYLISKRTLSKLSAGQAPDNFWDYTLIKFSEE